MSPRRLGACVGVVALLLAACRAEETPSRWPMRDADGPLRLDVRHPLPGDPRPASGRDYVMGSVGNGRATLTVDGTTVRVRRNGGFLAYVRAPAAGASYAFVATMDGDSAHAVVAVGGVEVAPVRASSSATASSGRGLTSGAVVLVPAGNRRGAGITEIAGRSEPEGNYAWFLLAGTRGDVAGVRDDLRLVRFSGGASAWIDRQFLAAAPSRARRGVAASSVHLEPRAGETDIVVAAPEPLAYEVTEGEGEVTFAVFGARLLRPTPPMSGGYVARLSADARDTAAVRVSAALRGPVFGYEVVWRPGAMVLRLRHPPVVDAAHPLAGVTIVVDAGHPPGGATGPTGLAEPVVTLDVARRLASLLIARGAHVVMTRADSSPVTLERRVAIARASMAHAFVSIHADAIASGADPGVDNGTAVFAFRDHAMPLANAERRALVARLGLPDRGVRTGDYAVVRSTWLPAVLCEGATLTIPEQEAALADPSFRAEYALGIADGLEEYFRALAQRLGSAR